jgi:hypothetical protein
VDSGKPFQTSGRSGQIMISPVCNRPYGDSMPVDIRSFPFALGARDVALACRQIRGDDIGPMRSHKSAASLLNSIYSR